MTAEITVEDLDHMSPYDRAVTLFDHWFDDVMKGAREDDREAFKRITDEFPGAMVLLRTQIQALTETDQHRMRVHIMERRIEFEKAWLEHVKEQQGAEQ